MKYPTLVIEHESLLNEAINAAFELVRHQPVCHLAKDRLYSLNSDLRNPVFFGGGGSHIWMISKEAAHLASDRETRKTFAAWFLNSDAMPERKAIIFFDPYN